MTCLHLHASLFPMHAKLKQQQQHHVGMEHTTKLLWGEPSMTNPHCKSFSSASSLRTKAIPDFIVVAATSPPKPRDPSTFLPISLLLVSVYFISNFVVPDILTKYFGFDKVNEEKKVEVDDVEDE
ncbi:unnamed protein product [Lathyrus oleraceus]|uniref:Transmembrane protein n=1 Tax=Pisum sativum TaxID=3888 RepID=A0A9D4Y5C9_PEA|nr:uncharacterized protein LOC127117668 [Pisum sativum]KAI5432973.1 hypothetical protein KIW84_020318 [Pisum sativum]KAI5432974.1 hypothetical protein KIW84_020318 [Pisum sativum]